MIRRVIGLVDELTGKPFHPRDQQESAWGIVLRFFGWPCECETSERGGCTYPGLGWRCGHRRLRLLGAGQTPKCPRCGHRGD